MNSYEELTKYVGRLYDAAYRKTCDALQAEELTQETLLAAVQTLSRGFVPDRLWSWLLTVLSNKHNDRLREKYNRSYIYIEDYPLELADESAEMLETEDAERLELIRRELGRLAWLHREVMVRRYIRNESVGQIAEALRIPPGTVKSRLNTGRRQIREGVNTMEHYAKQSYAPDMLCISISGETGPNNEPFSLVEADLLAQNILIVSYPKPCTISILSQQLGTPAAFLEPIVNRLADGELLRRTDSGKVYTDFIIYAEKDRRATLDKQLRITEESFPRFWAVLEPALAELYERNFFRRQTDSAQNKLALHFCLNLLMNATVSVRDEVAGKMLFSAYPHRKAGGRWLAAGWHYASDFDRKLEEKWKRYSVNGEYGTEIQTFRGAQRFGLRAYDTMLGGFDYKTDKTLQGFYELLTDIPPEQSAVAQSFLPQVGQMLEDGILKRQDGALKPDLPLLTFAEYGEERTICAKHAELLSAALHEELLSLFSSGAVRLPQHLNSVPDWQRYMLCGDSVPMAVILQAIDRKYLFADAKMPLSAVILLCNKQFDV